MSQIFNPKEFACRYYELICNSKEETPKNSKEEVRMTDPKKQERFNQEIDWTYKQFQKVYSSINEVIQKSDQGNLEGAYQSAFELAAESEKFTLLTRRLPEYAGSRYQAHDIMDLVIPDNFPVRIGFTPEGWLGMVIPTLLPKKRKGSSAYIYRSIYLSMDRFYRTQEYLKCCDESVIVFKHVYHHERPGRLYRNHDNIEVSTVIDVLDMFRLMNDSALGCEHYYYSTAGDDDRTEVFVVPKDEFAIWLAAAKDRPTILLDELLLR